MMVWRKLSQSVWSAPAMLHLYNLINETAKKFSSKKFRTRIQRS